MSRILLGLLAVFALSTSAPSATWPEWASVSWSGGTRPTGTHGAVVRRDRGQVNPGVREHQRRGAPAGIDSHEGVEDESPEDEFRSGVRLAAS